MKPEGLPHNIEEIVKIFREMAQYVNPHINVLGKLEGNRLVIDAKLPAEHNVSGEDPLMQFYQMLALGQSVSKTPASLDIEHPRSPVKKKLVYSLDVSKPGNAHEYVMEDKSIVLGQLLQEELLTHTKGAVNDLQPEEVKAALESALIKLTGTGQQVRGWGKAGLQELETSFAISIMKFHERSGSTKMIHEIVQSVIMYVDKHSSAGLWHDGAGKGRGGRMH